MDQEHSLSFGGVGHNKTITESVLLENGLKFPLPSSRMQSLPASCEVGPLLQNLFLVIAQSAINLCVTNPTEMDIMTGQIKHF